MPSSSAVYRPRDAVVDTSLVPFSSSSSKRNRSFDYQMDPASSLISPSSKSNTTALVVYDANKNKAVSSHHLQPMTKADPAYQRMKKQRKRRTAVAGASGVIVGSVIGGPVGAICCGAAGAATARKIGKMQQKRAVRRSEKASFQAAALDRRRDVHKSVFV
uniref:Glycine zipper domain-containing protein n=1 Tax=Minutocellus polymorphus TaxID=265543 RepID=A0A7S0FIU1_9STRA|mmetsp:Transcript_12695/g.21182  ORF Transcript_12695/g.21182 Transcript_12695/m.21182 type:complete len:161 (+) Transcript_12695:98-580(+)